MQSVVEETTRPTAQVFLAANLLLTAYGITTAARQQPALLTALMNTLHVAEWRQRPCIVRNAIAHLPFLLDSLPNFRNNLTNF